MGYKSWFETRRCDSNKYVPADLYLLKVWEQQRNVWNILKDFTIDVILVPLLLTLNWFYKLLFLQVFILDFEQVNPGWVE